jgi:hypothetical protein
MPGFRIPGLHNIQGVSRVCRVFEYPGSTLFRVQFVFSIGSLLAVLSFQEEDQRYSGR